MHGKEYTGYKVLTTENGKKKRIRIATKAPRTMGFTCASKSCFRTKLRACNEFPECVRSEIFHEFWILEWSAKKAYVTSLVDKVDPKYPRIGSGGKRGVSFFYHLKLYGVRRPVCRQMFLSTLGIKSKQLWGWLTSSKAKVGLDRKKQPSSQVSNQELEVREYLKDLPKLPSHYCRSDSENFYLEPVFSSKSELYNQYKLYCSEKSSQHVSRNTFLRIVTECKIKIYKPKKDQCDICVSQQVGNGDVERFELHRQRKEEARKEKVMDKTNSQKGECHVIAMDVQGVLMAPMLNASSLYYKTKLVVHNFTVYNLKTRHTTCFLWNETEGELVASVFATCLRKYLEKNFLDALPIIIFSDGCTYQNRNAVLSNSLLELSMRTKKLIIQKYLEKGHTQMEVDSVHATIQRCLKGKPIYLPSDYAEICAQARVFPGPYEVIEMNHSDFLDFSVPKNHRYSSIRPGNKSGEAQVTEIRQLKYTPEGEIHYKLNHVSDWRILPRVPRNEFPKKFPRLYKKGLPITKRKFQDLQDLLPVIPSPCHAFYKALSYKN